MSAVVDTIPIGANPGALALSDDESTLWVGIDGAYAMRKVTLTAPPPVIGPLRRLPLADDTQYYVAKMMVALPGAPLSVALLSWDRSSISQVHVFDDGVPRPMSVKGVPSADFLVGGPQGFVYGFQRVFDGDLFVFPIAASGIAPQAPVPDVFTSGALSAVYTRGKLHFGTGGSFDVSNPAAPVKLAGSLPSGGMLALRNPETLLALTTDLFTNPPTGAIHAIAIDSRTELASVPFPASLAPSFNASYSNLVYAGGDAVAFLYWDHVAIPSEPRLVVLHHPAIASPTGGIGGAAGGGIAGAGGGGSGGTGGRAGTGGDACPGCTFATVATARGGHMVFDAGRRLVYVAADALATTNANTIVTVDVATAAVTSVVPVGNNPQPLALADDGSVLWVGLADSRQVRRLTPGATPVAGPTYLAAAPAADDRRAGADLHRRPAGRAGVNRGQRRGIHVRGTRGVHPGRRRAARELHATGGGRRVAADQWPTGGAVRDRSSADKFVVVKLGAAGATAASHSGLVASSQLSLVYSGGMAYASMGEVVDVSSLDAPVRAGRFGFYNCAQSFRSASRVLMLCRDRVNGRGTKLHVMDTVTFAPVGSVTLPASLEPIEWIDIAYAGGDAVALLVRPTNRYVSCTRPSSALRRDQARSRPHGANRSTPAASWLGTIGRRASGCRSRRTAVRKLARIHL